MNGWAIYDLVKKHSSMSFWAIAVFRVVINAFKLHPVVPVFLAIIFVALRTIEGYKFPVHLEYFLKLVGTKIPD